MQSHTLITGGARSGKSNFAQELGLKSPQPVLFVATATPGDKEMRQRIEKHRKSRPPSWKTLEATANVGSQVLAKKEEAQTIIIDCITLLVSNVLLQYSSDTSNSVTEKAVTAEISGLIDCIDRAQASFIIVTNEVGLGLVPADPISRLYRDLLGKANQMLARRVDRVYLVVAGVPVLIKTTE